MDTKRRQNGHTSSDTNNSTILGGISIEDHTRRLRRSLDQFPDLTQEKKDFVVEDTRRRMIGVVESHQQTRGMIQAARDKSHKKMLAPVKMGVVCFACFIVVAAITYLEYLGWMR